MIKNVIKKILLSSLFFQKLYHWYCFRKYYIKQNSMFHNQIEKITEHGIVYVLAPGYSNIGDVAIFVQSMKFLKENAKLPIKAILYSLQSVNLENIRSLPLYDDDIIVIQGGGNMGAVYTLEEMLRQNIVKAFPNNRIISFPQSVWFGNEKKNYILKRAKKVYSGHKNLTIFGRDIPSLEFCKANFRCDVKLCPDMVLSAFPARVTSYEKNKKVLLCLRKDIESSLNVDKSKRIETILLNKGYSFEYWDTDDLSGRNIENKKEKIKQVLSFFNQFQFVITDRYHGTILSYISQTPCIALDNSYGKVKSGFYWFNGVNYMKFTEIVDEIPELIDYLSNLRNFVINESLASSFDELKHCLQ